MNGTEQAHTGVVDKDGDYAERGFSLRDQRSDFGGIGDIGTLPVHANTGRLKFVRRGFESGEVTPANRHRGAQSGEAIGNCLSNAPMSAGDQRDYTQALPGGD